MPSYYAMQKYQSSRHLILKKNKENFVPFKNLNERFKKKKVEK